MAMRRLALPALLLMLHASLLGADTTPAAARTCALAADAGTDRAGVAAQPRWSHLDDATRLLEQMIPDPEGPGMVVLVAQGEHILFRSARGMANLELKVPLTPDQVFRIGSVTKQFSAAGLLRLVDEGKVALADPLARFLPNFPNGEAITIEQLLNHTSGIRSYTDMAAHMEQEIRKDLDTDEMIRLFQNEPVDFPPGSRWQYNNSGYVLVGAVIERASGMPWARWLEHSMFRPLQLRRTLSGATREIVAGHAAGYSLADGSVLAARPLSMSQPHAAGALLSTVDDLLGWNLALHGGQVLSPEAYRRMITPVGAAAQGPIRYGYGLFLGSIRGRPAMEHGGGIYGFNSTLLFLPAECITVAVVRNADGDGAEDVGALAKRLAAMALGNPYPDGEPVALPRQTLQEIEGIYRLDPDTTRTLRLRDGILTSQRSGGARHELVPIGSDVFLFRRSLTRLELVRDEQGGVSALRFYPDGEGDGEIWTRSGEPVDEPVAVELSAAEVQRLLGRYEAPELVFDVLIDEEGELRIQVPGQPALRLKGLNRNLLFVSEVDARFEVDPQDGPVQAITLLQGTVRIRAERRPD